MNRGNLNNTKTLFRKIQINLVVRKNINFNFNNNNNK